jgi:hypothetical protein
MKMRVRCGITLLMSAAIARAQSATPSFRADRVLPFDDDDPAPLSCAARGASTPLPYS